MDVEAQKMFWYGLIMFLVVHRLFKWDKERNNDRLWYHWISLPLFFVWVMGIYLVVVGLLRLTIGPAA